MRALSCSSCASSSNSFCLDEEVCELSSTRVQPFVVHLLQLLRELLLDNQHVLLGFVVVFEHSLELCLFLLQLAFQLDDRVLKLHLLVAQLDQLLAVLLGLVAESLIDVLLLLIDVLLFKKSFFPSLQPTTTSATSYRHTFMSISI